MAEAICFLEFFGLRLSPFKFPSRKEEGADHQEDDIAAHLSLGVVSARINAARSSSGNQQDQVLIIEGGE